MLDFSMFFKAFKRPYEDIFNHGPYIGVSVPVKSIHKLDVMGNDIDFRFQQQAFQIINGSLHDSSKVVLNRQLRDFIAKWWIEKF